MARKKASLYNFDEPAKPTDYARGRCGLALPDGEECGLALFTGSDPGMTVLRVWQRRRSIDAVLDSEQARILRDHLSVMIAAEDDRKRKS